MPMVHVAAKSFFDATLRSTRFHQFDAVYHEGPPPGCTAARSDCADSCIFMLQHLVVSFTAACLLECHGNKTKDDPAYPTWRFTPSLRHASPSGAFLELSEAQRSKQSRKSRS